MENNETNHVHSNSSPDGSRKNFFEKYQTFFALVIVGVLIAAGIIAAKVVPNPSSNQNQGEQAPTQTQVRAQLVSIVKSIGLDTKAFGTCLDNGTEKQKIADATALAQASGVSGTPTFFILENGKQFPIIGARDENTFVQAITDGKSPKDQPDMPTGNKIVLSPTDHYTGPKDAKVVIVEYADIECPFCKAERPVINDILQKHPDYALVFRHAPIVSLHPWAEYKAEAAECVTSLGGEDAFWKFLNAAMQ